MKTQGRGRPPKPPEQRKSKPRQIRWTELDDQIVEAAALLTGSDFSAYVRRATIEAARRDLKSSGIQLSTDPKKAWAQVRQALGKEEEQ